MPFPLLLMVIRLGLRLRRRKALTRVLGKVWLTVLVLRTGKRSPVVVLIGQSEPTLLILTGTTILVPPLNVCLSLRRGPASLTLEGSPLNDMAGVFTLDMGMMHRLLRNLLTETKPMGLHPRTTSPVSKWLIPGLLLLLDFSIEVLIETQLTLRLASLTTAL